MAAADDAGGGELPRHDVDAHHHVQQPNPSFLTALVAGGVAGVSVDVALYPIDTIKVWRKAQREVLDCSIGFFASVPH